MAPVPIEIIGEVAPSAPVNAHGQIEMVLPSGVRVVGVTIEQVIQIARALG